MNKILKLMLLGAIGLSTSCSMDTESMTSINTNNFYKSMADVRLALIGCYDGYQRTVSDGGRSIFVCSELMSDDCFAGTGKTDSYDYGAIDRFDLSIYPTGTNLWEVTWISYYNAIFRCNSLLTQLDRVRWTSAADFNCDTPELTRAHVEGEIRFLRAVEYFDLVRMFENIPLLTTPTRDIVPQANPDDVYNAIFADLKYAAANIRYNATKEWYVANDGRATAEAAAALMARVYLFYTGFYGKEPAAEVVTKAEVIAALEDLVSGGKFGLVQAATDQNGTYNGFQRLWRAAIATANRENQNLDDNMYVGRGCKDAEVNEFIFTQKFNATQNYNGQTNGNTWLVMMGLRGVSDISVVPYGVGWGAGTVNPKSLAIFEPGDARLGASVIDYNAEGRQAAVGADLLADWREFTGYNLKKYIPLTYPVKSETGEYMAVPEVQVEKPNWSGSEGDNMISQYQDYVVIRYADVLLMLSELKEDASYMNLVRARAALGAAAYSKEAVMVERHREFMGEGMRYWDLLRQGINTAANTIAGSYTVSSSNLPETITISAQNIISKRGLSQIPENQIILSGNIYKQNLGW